MVLAVLVCLSFPPVRFQSFPVFSPSFPISFPLFLPSHNSFLCFKTSLPFQFQKSPLSSKNNLPCSFLPFSPFSLLSFKLLSLFQFPKSLSSLPPFVPSSPLSFVQTPLPPFVPSSPPLLVLRAVFIGQSLLLCVGSRGAACCRAWGEGDTG